MAETPPPEPSEHPEGPTGPASDPKPDLLEALTDLAGRDQDQLDELAGFIDALRRAGPRPDHFDGSAIWRRVEESLWGGEDGGEETPPRRPA